MTSEEQDDYSNIKAELGSVTLQVEGNHDLEETKAVFDKELKNVCDTAKGLSECDSDIYYD